MSEVKKYLGPDGVPILYDAIKDALTDMRQEVLGYKEDAEEAAEAAAQCNYRITISGTKINFTKNS